jgi:hypothetical protein
MARKDAENLEVNNKNTTGITASFNVALNTDKIPKSKSAAVLDDAITGYSLRLKKGWLKRLKIMSANSGTSVKDLILNAVADKYKL